MTSVLKQLSFRRGPKSSSSSRSQSNQRHNLDAMMTDFCYQERRSFNVTGSDSPLKFMEDHFNRSLEGDQEEESSRHQMINKMDTVVVTEDPLSTDRFNEQHFAFAPSSALADHFASPNNQNSTGVPFAATAQSPDKWQLRAGRFSPFKNDQQDENDEDREGDDEQGGRLIPGAANGSACGSPRMPEVTSRSAFSLPLFAVRRSPSDLGMKEYRCSPDSHEAGASADLDKNGREHELVELDRIVRRKITF